jgi:hypothetical protein
MRSESAVGVDCHLERSARYELESAVLCAFEVPDATARWLQGERVFAGCDQLRSMDRRV